MGFFFNGQLVWKHLERGEVTDSDAINKTESVVLRRKEAIIIKIIKL